MAAVLAGPGLLEAAPIPRWVEPDAQCRLVFSAPRDAGMAVLARLPMDERLSDKPFFRACDPKGTMLPIRVVFADRQEAWVLVELGAGAARENLALYCGRSSDLEPAPGPEPDAADPAFDPVPVAVLIHRPISKSPPSTWDRMLYVCERSGKPADVRRSHYFGQVDISSKKGKESDGAQRLGRIVRMSAMLICPEAGSYQFALNCREVAFLAVDGKPVARSGDRPGEKWSDGDPVILKAGVRRLDVFTFCEDRVAVGVGWVPPAGVQARKTASSKPAGNDAGGMAPVPVPQTRLVTPFEAENTRFERLDRTLHPAFRADLLPAYAYRVAEPDRAETSRSAVFVPVRLFNATVNWTDSPVKLAWKAPAGRVFDGTEPPAAGKTAAPGKGPGSWRRTGSANALLFGAELHKVSLSVRDALGFTGACEQTLDCRAAQPVEYKVGFQTASLPPVCRSLEDVEPTLSISSLQPMFSSGTPDLGHDIWKDLEIAWEVRRHSGAERFTNGVALSPDASEIPLARARVSDLDGIRWSARHYGAEIAGGEIRFLAPPFESLPVRAVADRLYDASGVQIVLVPHSFHGRYSQERELGSVASLAESCAAGRFDVAWLDDFFRLDGPDSTEPQAVRYLRTRLTREFPVARCAHVALAASSGAASAHAPLARLVEASGAIGGNCRVVLLSVGLGDMIGGMDSQVFELYAAALSDIVSATLKRRAVWVTPPPYRSRVGQARSYAVSVMKVADARSIPVADLYTAFMGAGNPDRFWIENRELELSEQGLDLAARVIARSLGAK